MTTDVTPEAALPPELTDDELFTVWDEHYENLLSYNRPSLDRAFMRAVIAADRAARALTPAPQAERADGVEVVAEKLKSLRRRRSGIVCGLLTAAACDKLDSEQDALIGRLAALATQQASRVTPYPLPDSLYPGSKDWLAGDYSARVEWLHTMYETRKADVERMEEMPAKAEPHNCRMPDGRCGMCGGDWSVCGC